MGNTKYQFKKHEMAINSNKIETFKYKESYWDFSRNRN